MLSLTMGDLIKDQELLKFLIDEAKKRMELSYDPRFPDLPVFLFFSNLAVRNRQQFQNYVTTLNWFSVSQSSDNIQ